MIQDNIDAMEDVGKDNPAIQSFLETGEGGVEAVKVRQPYKVPGVKKQTIRVNSRQQRILRRTK